MEHYLHLDLFVLSSDNCSAVWTSFIFVYDLTASTHFIHKGCSFFNPIHIYSIYHPFILDPFLHVLHTWYLSTSIQLPSTYFSVSFVLPKHQLIPYNKMEIRYIWYMDIFASFNKHPFLAIDNILLIIHGWKWASAFRKQ